MSAEVVRICRYPVKGLSAEDLPGADLDAGKAIPHDRRFALARPGTEFDPANPEWMPKTRFLMLMRDEELAQLRSRFDEHNGYLTIARDGRTVLRARITDPEGKEELADFFAMFMRNTIGEKPHVVEAPGHTFADAERRPHAATGQYVSIVNLSSVRALEAFVGMAVDPLRFRANFYVEGWPAWRELDMVGSDLAIGEARLRVVSRIKRCAATEVNPTTAERDVNIPKKLQVGFGHVFMGLYAEVIAPGRVEVGDRIRHETQIAH